MRLSNIQEEKKSQLKKKSLKSPPLMKINLDIKQEKKKPGKVKK